MILGPLGDGVLGIAATVAATVIILAIGITFVRVVRGPSLPDRVMGLDAIGSMAVSAIVTTAILAGEPVLLDAAIALAAIAFLGTLAFARFIERREGSDE